MAALTGQVEVELLVRTGRSKPISIGTIDVPIETTTRHGRAPRVNVQPTQVRRGLAHALAQAAEALSANQPSNRQKIQPHP